LGLALGEIILGVVIDKLFDPRRSSVPFHDKLHWYAGRLLLIGGITNAGFGLVSYTGTDWLWGLCGLWFLFLLSLFFYLEKSQGVQLEGDFQQVNDKRMKSKQS
jgi:hypothetical protein